ncbi:hypothetical protein BHE74_00036643 [Ensete ventricosum]|nr:hypothetical protein BHE74_00036643 [Ensete ventricosum]
MLMTDTSRQLCGGRHDIIFVILLRSAGLVWRRKEVVSSDADGDDDNESGGRTPPSMAAAECYACTQPGVPAFHSTTCDRVHSPEWEASAGSSLIPIRPSQTNVLQNLRLSKSASLLGGSVLDPRSEKVRRWNRVILLARAVAVAVDPLFFYALSVGRRGDPCLYMDGGLAVIVTVLRTAADAVHLVHVWLQFRVAYVSRESLVVGCGKLVWDARMVAAHYLRSLGGFWFDVFVILPVPQVSAPIESFAFIHTVTQDPKTGGCFAFIRKHQRLPTTWKCGKVIRLYLLKDRNCVQVVFWLIVPKLIREEKIKLIMTIFLLIFVFQFLPKVYHSICVMRRMQKVTGYIFGTIWWGFGLNLIAYFIASHVSAPSVAGGCWYVLAIQRVAACLQQQCEKNNNCDLVSLACSKEVCYHLPLASSMNNMSCEGDLAASIGMQNTPVCLNGDGPFPYGIYNWALPVVSSNSLVVKILYPIFWGLMTLR